MPQQRVARKSLRRPTTFYGGNEDVPPMPRKSQDLPATAIIAAGGGKRYKPKAPNKHSDNDPRKSRLDEKLKKRLSVKYTYQQPSAHDAPPVPTLPKTHIQDKHTLQPEDVRESLFEDGDDQRVSSSLDIINREWLQQSDFDAQAYVRTHLANANPTEVAHFKQALNESMHSTNTQLEQSAFKNYSDFISISKEIGSLETEVLELRELLNEWRNLPEAFGIDENAESDMDRVKRNRSSIADLAVVYRTQLQTLHSTVEGSLKHVPHAPGRHIVMTSAKFVELNAATYRIAQSVEIVLLNDTLLIASKRRRQASQGREKLIADRAWSFSDITIQDVRDSSKVKNAIKVKHSKQSYVYMADSPNDKSVLLNAVKRVVEEYQAQIKQQHNQEGDLSPNFVLSPSMASVGSASSPMRTPITSSNKYLQWMEDYVDELSVSVALNDYGTAVEHIDKGRKLLRSTDGQTERDTLQTQITHHKKILVKDLLHVIEDSSKVRKSVVIDTVALLHRLGETTLAKETYFNSRKELIRRRSRQMVFDGDVVNYLAELAAITFTIIKQSAEWFRAAFNSTNKANGFGYWASEQIKTFATMFKRQISASYLDKDVIERAIEITKEQGLKVSLSNISLNVV
ncbi:hypothetical protein E3Q14_00374 [Wallemia mellicola]|nr:hypothetical protein E3Q14_00374 [Wallemia mellicola]